MHGFEKIAEDTLMLATYGRVCSTIYLIEKNGKRLVIDSGDGKAVIGFVPDICILTHGHFDHTQGVEKEWPLVMLHKNEFTFGGPYISIPKNAKKNPMDDIVFEGHRLKFHHTPGHTDGSICIHDLKTGVLFSGDTKFAEGGFGRTDLNGSDEKMVQSLAHIDSLPYRLLCPGHGGIEERG